MRSYTKYMIVLSLLPAIVSCKKLVEVDPPKAQLTPEKAFVDNQSATAVLSNIYAQFNSFIGGNLTPQLGLYVDELSTTSADAGILEYDNEIISTTNSSNLNFWKGLYSVIYQCNALLENIELSSNITQTVKQQLKGEAHFLRAFSYFYLINSYGDVPLLVTTDLSVTSSSPRDSMSHVYSQIITDLEDAKAKLGDNYPSTGKVRANKWAAVALLARVHLYQQNWQTAEAEATEVIDSGMYGPLDDLNTVFLENSTEAILQFWTQNGFTVDGSIFIPSESSVPTYLISADLLNSFETGDQRKSSWINSIVQDAVTYNYPFKYKNTETTSGGDGEYLTALRLSEQYLIRSEARARRNNLSGALDDLDVVRNRAGLLNTMATTQPDIIAAIEKERRVELFVEWGHRFYDLKRNGHINQILSALKPAWHDASALLPIPQYELLNNPWLTQNPDY